MTTATPLKCVTEIHADPVTQTETTLSQVWRELAELPSKRTSGLLNYHLRYTLKGIFNSPFTFIATVLTGLVTYLICAFGLLVLENTEQAITLESSDLVLTMYLQDNVTEDRAKELISNLQIDRKVEGVTYISKEEALNKLSEMLGSGSVLLDGLEEDVPLPRSLEIRFKPDQSNKGVFQEYTKAYGDSPDFERIEYNKGWLDYLASISNFVTRWGVMIMVVLVTISAFVVFNTTRLGLYAHRKEIEIMKLLGARDNFVRASYIIEGLLHGLISGLLSIAILYGVYSSGLPYIQSSELINSIFPQLFFLSPLGCIAILVIAIAVGGLSAWLGTRRLLDV